MENPQAQAASAPTSAAPDAERRADYQIAIGNNADYYLEKFDAFDAGASRAGWHWPAFLVPGWWCLYRKLWLPGVLFLLWPLIALILFSIAMAVVIGASMSIAVLVCVIAGLVVLAPYIVLPIFANAFYWRHTHKLIEQMSRRFPRGDAQREARLKRDGGTSVGPMLGIMLGFGVVGCGMLAAIAIPAYQDYTIRSQITEGLTLASPAKAEVSDYWAEHHAWPQQSELGGGPLSGAYTADVSVESGSIVITYGNKANPNIAGKRLVLQPGLTSDQEVVWACAYVSLPDGATAGEGPHGSEVPAKYLPKACRGQ